MAAKKIVRKPAILFLIHPTPWQAKGLGEWGSPTAQFDFRNDPRLKEGELVAGPAAGGYTVKHPRMMDLEIGPCNVKSVSWYEVEE